MKIALSSQDGIAILTGSGEIGPHDLDVLRAGFSKLLKSGRNRIVLELPESDKIPGDMIREISRFDVFARELLGRIVLAGNEALCARVAQFARPPVIHCFAGREKAVEALKSQTSAPETGAPQAVAFQPATAAPAPAPATPVVPAASFANAGDAQAKHKADIRQKELTDLTSLRKRISKLENENRLLMEQLLDRVGVGGASEASRATEVTILNQRIEELLSQIRKEP